MIRSDFADIFEVKAKKVTRRGEIRTRWSADAQELATCYRHDDFSRSVQLTTRCQQSTMTYANGRLNFKVDLRPGGSWRTCLLYALADGDAWSPAPQKCISDYMRSSAIQVQRTWQASVLKIQTENRAFASAFAQAICDMASLRLPIADADQPQFVPAAGLPWFIALFGRDSLIISLQTAIVHPEFSLGALLVLASGRPQSKTITATPNLEKFCTSCGAASWRISTLFLIPLTTAAPMLRRSI